MQAPLQAKVESDVVQTKTARAATQEQRLVDNRPTALVQRRLAEMMNNSPRALQLQALSYDIHNGPRMVAQRHEMNALFGGAVKPRGDGAMPAEASLAQREEKTNNTGLPNQLKSGIESLSGMSMDRVKVHYNSDKPAQLQAHAYAQGSEIHLGTGQEKHLPHEAWHVVQQAQGRVRPTLQMKAGAVNDDPSLEREADMMGEKAAQFEGDHVARNLVAEEREAGVVTQRVAGFLRAVTSVAGATAQLVAGKNRSRTKARKKGSASSTYGSCDFSKELPLTVQKAVFYGRPPSNSRSGQGDHVVAYSLITQAVSTSVNGKSLVDAGQSLARLVTKSAKFVGDGNSNKWWHTSAEALITTLDSIGENEKAGMRSGINSVMLLLNIMPGTAIKRKKSTGGHNEGGSKGGIQFAEQKVKKGDKIKSNIWVNVLNLFDGAADSALLSDQTKLDSKLGWLMTLFSTAAPKIVELIKTPDLTLIPGTNLQEAVDDKFEFPVSAGVHAFIGTWLTG